MKLKINTTYINILIFISFFFLWGVDTTLLSNFDFIKNNEALTALTIKYKIKLKYLILLFLIPIFLKLAKEIRFISFSKIFNDQKYILILSIFLILQFFSLKIFNEQIIETKELYKLILLILLSIIFSHYRFFLKKHFTDIIFIFLIIFVFSAYYPTEYKYNIGQCNNKFFLFYFIENNFNILISSKIFIENSHLAMMMVAVLFSTFMIITTSKNANFIFILLMILSVVAVSLNYSTTFFVCYLASFIVMIIFFHRKLPIKFWILAFLFLILNASIFFADTNCTKKVTDVSLTKILSKEIVKKTDTPSRVKNLTTLIYERSAILALDTFQNYPLGWGFDGMDDATSNLLNKDEYKNIFIYAKILNLNDGLSNFFKILTEFGIFSVFILYFFIKYIFNLKKVNPYNLFIIVLFVTLCVRGAGYFNGGFLFCLFELFYIKKINDHENNTVIK
tara:strand:+ start:3373 stop:4722 length:1350 start_codon:yes stop_codon:yes gene_type:complete